MSLWRHTFAKALEPRELITGSQWADRYRYIDASTSSQPGPWDTDFVPYLREPMDVGTNHETREIVMKCSSQVGKTELLLNIMGYYADQEPAAQLMMQPTVGLAKAFSKERVDPMFKTSKGLKGKLMSARQDEDSGGRKTGDTIELKQYPGGYIAFVGAESPRSLASRPIRIVLGDELDRMPRSTSEGSPLKLAAQRTRNSPLDKKIIWVSTPTNAGESVIDELYEDSDRRVYEIPTPCCGVFTEWKFTQVRYQTDEQGYYVEGSAWHKCPHCGGKIRGDGRPDIELLRLGSWRATNPGHSRAGFYMNSLCSPWVTLAEICVDHAEAKRTRDPDRMKTFQNLLLGEVYEPEIFAKDHGVFLARRERYRAQVPDEVLVLTAGVDIQAQYIAMEVVGWNQDLESWGIEYKILPGDTSLPHVWNQLERELSEPRLLLDGSPIYIACAAVDSGYNATQVYGFTKPREFRRVYAVKGGSQNDARVFVDKPTTHTTGGALLWVLGVSEGKSHVYSYLGLEEHGPRYCHFPDWNGYDEEYFRGLFSEKRYSRVRNGRREVGWEKTYERNEPLDCRVYAYAALKILNPDFSLIMREGSRSGSWEIKQNAAGRRVITRGAHV